MKILLLSPNQIGRYNWGHQLFRNEIGRQHDVVYYGRGYSGFNEKLSAKQIIKKKYKNSNPDLIITYGWRYSKEFNGLGLINIPKVHITVDYGRPAGIPKQNKFFKENKYDLVFGITSNAIRLLEENKVCDKIRMLPFSVDTNIYKKNKLKKEDIILASFTARKDIYPNRSVVRKSLKKAGFRLITKRVIHQALINAINKCKITVTSNNIFKSLSMRYTETLACGGFLLADRPEDLTKLGFVDGEHLVIYKTPKDLVRKAKYYMEHDKERERIARNGMDFVRKNHSCEKRVKEMTEIIQKEFGI
jgi:glycosyltransferase involved in cell wall biosynthesis